VYLFQAAAAFVAVLYVIDSSQTFLWSCILVKVPQESCQYSTVTEAVIFSYFFIWHIHSKLFSVSITRFSLSDY